MKMLTTTSRCQIITSTTYNTPTTNLYGQLMRHAFITNSRRRLEYLIMTSGDRPSCISVNVIHVVHLRSELETSAANTLLQLILNNSKKALIKAIPLKLTSKVVSMFTINVFNSVGKPRVHRILIFLQRDEKLKIFNYQTGERSMKRLQSEF